MNVNIELTDERAEGFLKDCEIYASSMGPLHVALRDAVIAARSLKAALTHMEAAVILSNLPNLSNEQIDAVIFAIEAIRFRDCALAVEALNLAKVPE